MKRLRSLVPAALLLAVIALLPGGTAAHETDQYSIRHAALTDSTLVLNEGFNEMLSRIAAAWRRGENRRKFAKRVFKVMGGRHFIDRYERWARQHPEVEMLRVPREESIYRGGPFWQTRVVFFFGLGPVVKIDGQLVGVDKMGHFLSIGWKYHRRHLRGKSDEEVVALGQRNEAGIFGFATTGVFSNADLVANYEGYLFYRSLFEDDIVPGKPAIIAFEGRRARLQRPFDWRDHVNAFWDEALNPSIYDPLLRKRVSNHLGELCHMYFDMPEAFEVPEREALSERYALLGLRDASEYSLEHVCTSKLELAAGSGGGRPPTDGQR